MQDGVQAAGRGWPWGDGKALHPLRSGAELATTLSRHVLHYKPATAAISLGQQNALAGDEGLAQDKAEAVRKAALLPAKM